MEFRLLTADEIECRVGSVGKQGNGFSLLLYKDARCDMALLDETVGAMNWTKSYSRENANCTVSIWDDDKKQWVAKEDTGTESNTEKEKGLASDSFKRACFNWGIGRELYTAPFIWVSGYDPKTDRFRVSHITYKDKKIDELTIVHSKTGEVVFQNGSKQPKSSTTSKKTSKSTNDTSKAEKQNLDDFSFDEKVAGLKQIFNMLGEAQQEFLDYLMSDYGYSSIDEIKEDEINAIGKVAKNLKITNDKRKEN